MRLRNTLLLTVVFGLLGAYLYFYELKNEGEERTERLLNFKQDEVESITLSYPQQEIRLQREPSGKWKITQPLQVAADESTISDILSTLNTTEIKRTVEEKPSPQDLKAFELDKPQVKVLITLEKGKALPPILVGGKTPVGNSAYVKRGDKPDVLLTSASLLSSLKKKLYDFRDKKIIRFQDDSVEQLALKGTKGDFVLIKKAQDWFIDKPKSYRADRAEIQGMLSTIRNMSARDFTEESPSDLKKYGLDQPRLQVTVFMGDKEGPREILFGNKREGKDEVYLVLDSKEIVYTVYESVFRELDKDLVALRDKEILPFPRDKVAKLKIHTPKQSWVLVKGEKEEWQVEAPEKRKTKQRVVADYLRTLGYLRAKGFAEDEPKDIKQYGFDLPSLKISLEAKDGKNLGTLLLASKAGEVYYAKREGNPTVYIIEEFSYNQINKQLTDFLKEEKKESLHPSETEKTGKSPLS
ncbi:MAG: DUF4340 domain-containing protein [Deltaproteobacteria bacterium]|nr:DUF4340 domain-containing protein [Deltaproteobacteria bacterium]